MRNLLAIVLLFISVAGMAHKPNEAFFYISPGEGKVEIKAEFPWTLRDALIAFDSSLVNAKGKEDFEAAFVRYVRSNLILTGRDGNTFDFVGFQELSNGGHSHQNMFVLTYQGVDLNTISNTMLFNIYSNQKNYHTMILDSEERTDTTSVENADFTISTVATSGLANWALLLLVFPIAHILIGRKRLLPKSKRS